MAVYVTTRLRGDKELARILSVLKNPKSLPIFRRALKRSAELARKLTRSDFLSGQMLGYVTGDLFDSIALRSKYPSKFQEVFSALPQSKPLHWGWPAHNLPARPFIEAGVQKAFPSFAGIWIEEIEREVAAA